MIEFPKIILASASPRRAEILRTVGWPFEALPVDIDETRHHGESAIDYVQRLAREKATAAHDGHLSPDPRAPPVRHTRHPGKR